MEFAATRIITDDVDRLVGFYERLTGRDTMRAHPLFAEVRTPRGTLAIASSKTVPLLGEDAAEAGANRSVIFDLLVDDVDEVYSKLQEWVGTFVNKPTDMPWGNRSLLLRDPDGNLVNVFTPQSAKAGERAAR